MMLNCFEAPALELVAYSLLVFFLPTLADLAEEHVLDWKLDRCCACVGQEGWWVPNQAAVGRRWSELAQRWALVCRQAAVLLCKLVGQHLAAAGQMGGTPAGSRKAERA